MKSAWKDTLVDYGDDDVIQRIEKHEELQGWSGRCWVLHLNLDYRGHDKFIICATHSDPDTDPIMVTPIERGVDDRWSHHHRAQMFQTDEPKPYDEVVEQVKEELIRHHN